MSLASRHDPRDICSSKDSPAWLMSSAVRSYARELTERIKAATKGIFRGCSTTLAQVRSRHDHSIVTTHSCNGSDRNTLLNSSSSALFCTSRTRSEISSSGLLEVCIGQCLPATVLRSLIPIPRESEGVCEASHERAPQIDGVVDGDRHRHRLLLIVSNIVYGIFR